MATPRLVGRPAPTRSTVSRRRRPDLRGARRVDGRRRRLDRRRVRQRRHRRDARQRQAHRRERRWRTRRRRLRRRAGQPTVEAVCETQS